MEKFSSILKSLLLLFSFSASPNATTEFYLHAFKDILTQLYVHIHGNQKNLQYWIAIAERSDPTYHGVLFKLYETMPSILEGGRLLKFEPELTSKRISPKIWSKIHILLSVRYHLYVFVSKVHQEMMKLKSSPENLLKCIATLDGYISGLKDSIERIAYLDPFTIDNPMSDETPRDAVDGIYRNVIEMDSYLSSLAATYRKPSKILQKAMLVTVFGTIAVVTLSVWGFNQSGPLCIVDSTVAVIKDFLNDNVKEPLANLKDELFNKSMKRAMELKEVEELGFNKEMLRRMLLDIMEQTTDDRSYTNKSNEEILDLVVERTNPFSKVGEIVVSDSDDDQVLPEDNPMANFLASGGGGYEHEEDYDDYTSHVYDLPHELNDFKLKVRGKK